MVGESLADGRRAGSAVGPVVQPVRAVLPVVRHEGAADSREDHAGDAVVQTPAADPQTPLVAVVADQLVEK